ncbi:MAG: hypothetical protein IT440_10890 [Phycisphaeraceae bacterium]|nr:hypothetical protein [Phycisphaeraceae bacterium]
MNENDSSREHGVIHDGSVRTVGMTPRYARHVIREEEDLQYPLLASSLVPPRCTVTIDPDPIGVLVNGLGANWSPAFQGEEAFPEDDDENGWRHLFKAMSHAGLRWVRYWLHPADLFVDNRVNARHSHLRRLDRLQDWASRENATLMLELGLVPESYQIDSTCDAPRDNRAYVGEYVIPLLRHVVKERGIDRIRQLCLFNEPFNSDVTPFIFTTRDPAQAVSHYVELHEICRAAMIREGMAHVGLIGPNTANMFQRMIELMEDQGLSSRVAQAFTELDGHMWRMRLDHYPPSRRWPGYTMTEGVERYLKPTLAAARRMGKTYSLTESGSMYFNDHPRTSRNTRHDCLITMAEQTIRALNEGIAGAMIWSFTNSGRIDGQWGWIGTRQQGFKPVLSLLNGFAVLMRPQVVGGNLHHCTIARSDFSSYISAASLFAGDHGETLWLVNDHPVQAITVNAKLPANFTGRPLTLLLKGFDDAVDNSSPLTVDNATVSVTLPGMTLAAITSVPSGTSLQQWS